jgi:hypothetical protein
VLTEHERRALSEIELQLGLTDPRFAARLAGSRRERLLYRSRAWRGRLSCTGIAAGLTLMLVFYASEPFVALVGVALLIAVWLPNAARVGIACQQAVRRASRWWRQLGLQSDEA